MEEVFCLLTPLLILQLQGWRRCSTHCFGSRRGRSRGKMPDREMRGRWGESGAAGPFITSRRPRPLAPPPSGSRHRTGASSVFQKRTLRPRTISCLSTIASRSYRFENAHNTKFIKRHNIKCDNMGYAMGIISIYGDIWEKNMQKFAGLR